MKTTTEREGEEKRPRDGRQKRYSDYWRRHAEK